MSSSSSVFCEIFLQSLNTVDQDRACVGGNAMVDVQLGLMHVVVPFAVSARVSLLNACFQGVITSAFSANFRVGASMVEVTVAPALLTLDRIGVLIDVVAAESKY